MRLPSLQPAPSFWLAPASTFFVFFFPKDSKSAAIVWEDLAQHCISSHPPEYYCELLAALIDSLLLKCPLWISLSARFDLVAWKWCLWMFSCWIFPSPQVPSPLSLSSQESKCPSEDHMYLCMEISNGEVIEVIVGIGSWLILILLNFFSLSVWWSSSYCCCLSRLLVESFFLWKLELSSLSTQTQTHALTVSS